MKVWIDTDACVGDGICAEVAPEVFALDADEVAHVCEQGKLLPGRGPEAIVAVPAHCEDAVLDAAEQCPSACIMVEPS